MVASKSTPAEVVQEQHLTMLAAFIAIRDEIARMSTEVSPETTSWGDVSKFAHAADAANALLERLQQ